LGTLSAAYTDGSTDAAFSLVAGDGSTDNAAFTIAGNSLKAAAAFDYETKSSSTIRVSATPVSGSNIIEQVLTIQVTDLDEIQPTVVVLSTASGPTDSNPIPVNIDFSEDVTGFVIGDITVTGGTAANFAGSGKNYSVEVVPSAALVTVDVAALVAQDAAGNGNTVANQWTITYNLPNAAPTNLALSATSLNEKVAAGTAVSSPKIRTV
jgi:hypothetical protein